MWKLPIVVLEHSTSLVPSVYIMSLITHHLISYKPLPLPLTQDPLYARKVNFFRTQN
ncbi:hypothetical protein Hdeb2414_s0064g00765871 [Helianthus debilis subsp. tardiflorus]